jgi:hypothetical protein
VVVALFTTLTTRSVELAVELATASFRIAADEVATDVIDVAVSGDVVIESRVKTGVVDGVVVKTIFSTTGIFTTIGSVTFTLCTILWLFNQLATASTPTSQDP